MPITSTKYLGKCLIEEFGKESTCNAGDPSSIPGSARSPGEGIGYPLQCSWASLVAQLVKNLPAVWGDLGSIPGLGRSPGEVGLYPTPVFWPGEFHGLYSPWGSQKIGHDWATSTFRKLLRTSAEYFNHSLEVLRYFVRVGRLLLSKIKSLGNVKQD